MLCVTMEMQYSFSSDKIHNHISSIIPLAQPINLYHNIMQECSISLHRSYDEITQCRSAQPISYITDWRVTLTGYSPSSTWQSLNVPIRRSRSLMIHDRQAGEHANWWTWKSQRPSLFPAGSVAVWLSEGGDASVGSPPLILLLLSLSTCVTCTSNLHARQRVSKHHWWKSNVSAALPCWVPIISSWPVLSASFFSCKPHLQLETSGHNRPLDGHTTICMPIFNLLNVKEVGSLDFIAACRDSHSLCYTDIMMTSAVS